MTEALCLLGPGAITRLVSSKLCKKEKETAAAALTEILAYSALDTLIIWEILCLRLGETLILSEVVAKLTEDVLLFGLALFVGGIVGVLASVLRASKIEMNVKNNPDGFWRKMSPGKRKIIKRTVPVVLISAIVIGYVRPVAIEFIEMRQKAECQERASTLLTEVRNAVKETGDGELGDLIVDGLTIKKVETDQRWITGCDDVIEEAVYMVDGNRTVVYLSYRTQKYTATWSGPSTDQAFIEAQGGWSGGEGVGWTGSCMN